MPTPAVVHPYRTSRCRNNLQQPVAPRRQGPWVPSLSRRRVFGPSPPFIDAIHAGSRAPLFVDKWQLGRVLFGLPAQEFCVSPLRHLVGSWVAALELVPPLHGAGSH